MLYAELLSDFAVFAKIVRHTTEIFWLMDSAQLPLYRC